ncbi:hypothetical protein NKR23_g7268 [Pleurostoma richardsiae]|uniref:Transmembrane protein n=1 Tax=Pleurostoma richardsiae TaxID=41990 RepID=A0AA38RMB4_9PEZI|nr:hypothetical protein NKR23_g7268 [Pleurostoma richardsiae]
MNLLPHYELSLLQRMLLIWVFIIGGLVIGFQAGQQYAEAPKSWTRLTKETKPYWYTFYIFEAFMLSQITYRVFLFNMSGQLFGYEEVILDGIWFGLLGLEALMIAGLVARRLFMAVSPKSKVKAQ